MKKVLIIEDDEVIRIYAEKTLSEGGYEVATAEDGKQGYEKAVAIMPELIVLDLMMPVMHGFDTCQALRRDHRFDKTKIVITSGKRYPVDKKAAIRLGADGYLEKPYSARQLLTIAAHLLELPKP
ncbi:MAG: response regulator [Elusimicrobiota bacterium]